MNATPTTQLFLVSGMTCGHCENAVRQAIAQRDPQAQTRIDRATGQVQVHSDQPREALAAAIQDEGYAVTGV
jgi:copper chaperone